MEESIKDLQNIKLNEAYCFACGSIIKKEAEICPKCGVNQNKRKETTKTEVYCISCGQVIKKEAEICVKCGVRQFPIIKKKNGFAITSLVFGILSGIYSIMIMIIAVLNNNLNDEYNPNPAISFLPMIIICFILSCVFGSISYAKFKHKLALTGLILCGITLVFTIVAIVFA